MTTCQHPRSSNGFWPTLSIRAREVSEKVFATLPIGLVDPESVSPYRLALGPVVLIPLVASPPPRFDGDREDLDLGDADEEEASGEAA